MILSALVICTLVSSVNAATAPCGISGTLNVGISQFNQPYSDFSAANDVIFGFDVDLVLAIAQILGYSVNFVFVSDLSAAETALLNGTIDIYANSATILTNDLLAGFQGLITDVSHILDPSEPQAATTSPYRGYVFRQECCNLISRFEVALSYLVQNGIYAYMLQKERANPLDFNTANMGQYSFTPTGPNILVEPLPYNSSMAGTILQGVASSSTGITGCGSDLIPLSQFNPATSNCYVAANPNICYTFTGASGATGPVSGAGCLFIP